MSLMELSQVAWQHVAHAVDFLGYAPDPTPTTTVGPAPKTINTQAVIGFVTEKIAPILLAALGVIFIGRASKGEVSRVMTSSAIAIIGLAFIAGGVALFAFGSALVALMFQ